MKKIFVLAAIAFAFCLVSCSADNGTINDTVKDDTIKFDISYNVSYDTLINLVNNNQLDANKLYKINDYETIVKSDNEYMSANHKFDIVVRAIDSSNLDENAVAVKSTRDSYFDNSNLASWDIKYSIYNNTNLYEWASSNGKGVIYYMKDEYDNEFPYDFKNILFKRYKVTGVSNEASNEFLGNYYAFKDCYGCTYDQNDYKWCYTFEDLDNPNPNDALITASRPIVSNHMGIYHMGTDFKQRGLNNIVFYSTASSVETVDWDGRQCKDNYFNSECHHWTLGGDFTQNTIESCSRYNIIGQSFNHNDISTDFQYNIIGQAARFNTFDGDFSHNIVGKAAMANQFHNVINYNIFGDNFMVNTVYEMVLNCEFKNNISMFTVGKYCRNCVVDSNISTSSLGDNCANVKIQNDSETGYAINYHIYSRTQFEELMTFSATLESKVEVIVVFDHDNNTWIEIAFI
ncbi:MAG: hypothetical protein ACI35W_06600 [Anaeroplasmataceae bacterium]